MPTAVKSLSPPVNPRWVVSALKTRGIATPTAKSAELSIAAMPAGELEDFRGRVQRAHMGIDREDDLEELAKWARAVIVEQNMESPVPRHGSSHGGTPTAANHPAANDVTGGPQPHPKPAGDHVGSTPKAWEPSHHIYGSKSALSVEVTEVASEMRSQNDRPDSFWTLQMEMAPALTKQRYDWGKKIIFRLTKRELPLLASVLFGWTNNVTFSNHGPSNDKEFSIEDQGSHFFVKLRMGKKVLALPIGGDELFALSALILKVLGKNAPHLQSQTILQIVKRAGPMYARSVGEAV